jgi:gamma-glutamyltranspeptidase/glutathione hydrolase
VLSAVVDHGVDVATAVEGPRLHPDGDHIEVEPGWPGAALAALAALGTVNVWSAPNLYFGGVHAVAPGRGAAGDPRRDGASRTL